MRHDPATIESALAPLVGLPLWASGRAADLQWFQLGAQHLVTVQHGPTKGTERTVGDYALHVQCAWRISGPTGIVVASRDRYVPAGDPDKEPPEWRWDRPGANRCDQRIETWCLALSHGHALEVFPDDSQDGEHWRLLQPARDADHFVVTGAGIR
jgi:hypothetical protein